MGSLLIRPAVPADLPRLTELYNHYVVNTAQNGRGPKLNQTATHRDEQVDMASEDSFPASDAPSFTPTTPSPRAASRGCRTTTGQPHSSRP